MKRPPVKRRSYEFNRSFFDHIPSPIFELPIPCEQMLMLNEIFWSLLENKYGYEYNHIFSFYEHLEFTKITKKSEAITWKHAKALVTLGYIIIEGKGGQKTIEPGEKLNEILNIYRR